ncbi:hypothetical protein SARC_01073 [Sphaeroforma arctica JP610]|uniref:Phosphotransferase n=1 Tax=Sphaeroforma arctica JP610 TaxID=667725 RepID=A0A0L0GCY9_9EUKA|nr:hypothetical protein SARC_01073 [Sphaeroforma arctica JP610]KNC86779.1 hypothetical protein SARC_01073 [Sphaeroforma arctica JP610]|eukprot:XP_014160681.1 hypothetical protein SARC_01073 [Sphaeroforma arctica JP610]
MGLKDFFLLLVCDMLVRVAAGALGFKIVQFVITEFVFPTVVTPIDTTFWGQIWGTQHDVRSSKYKLSKAMKRFVRQFVLTREQLVTVTNAIVAELGAAPGESSLAMLPTFVDSNFKYAHEGNSLGVSLKADMVQVAIMSFHGEQEGTGQKHAHTLTSTRTHEATTSKVYTYPMVETVRNTITLDDVMAFVATCVEKATHEFDSAQSSVDSKSKGMSPQKPSSSNLTPRPFASRSPPSSPKMRASVSGSNIVSRHEKASSPASPPGACPPSPLRQFSYENSLSRTTSDTHVTPDTHVPPSPLSGPTNGSSYASVAATTPTGRDPHEALAVGLCVALPITQVDVSHGELLRNTKNYFSIAKFENRNLAEVLLKHLKEKGLNTQVVAVLNDVTAKLVASHVIDERITACLYVGKGVNFVYKQHSDDYVNTELGGFHLPANVSDRLRRIACGDGCQWRYRRVCVCGDSDCIIVKYMCETVSLRAANLAACSLAAVFEHLELERMNVALAGEVHTLTPGFRSHVMAGLDRLNGSYMNQIKLKRDRQARELIGAGSGALSTYHHSFGSVPQPKEKTETGQGIETTTTHPTANTRDKRQQQLEQQELEDHYESSDDEGDHNAPAPGPAPATSGAIDSIAELASPARLNPAKSSQPMRPSPVVRRLDILKKRESFTMFRRESSDSRNASLLNAEAVAAVGSGRIHPNSVKGESASLGAAVVAAEIITRQKQ